MKWLTGYRKKREAAKGFSNQQTLQTAQTFILEPILTPSGILDGTDDTPDPITLDWETNNLPDVNTVDSDSNVDVDDVAEGEVSEINSDFAPDSSQEEIAINSLETDISDENIETVDFIEHLDSPEVEGDGSPALEVAEFEIVQVNSPKETADSNPELTEISNPEVTTEVSSKETEISHTSQPNIDVVDDPDLQLITDSETDSNKDLSISDSANEVDEFDTTLVGGEADETTEFVVDDIIVDDNSFSDPYFHYNSGVFTVGETGEVGIDFLFDGGGYKGELAIFSLAGMDEFEPGSHEFIKEAASRALSSSDLGHIVIADATEGAKFSGDLGEANRNEGAYLGVKTFTMRPGDTFAVMLVPNGKVEQVFNNPAIGGAVRPLFSLVTSNPNDAFHVGQIADITGDGNTFVMEDMRVDTGSDRDYNDIIFQVRGATGKAALMDDVVASGKDWRTSDLGQALIAYAEPYIEPEIVENDFFVDDDSLIYDDELAFYDEYLDSQFDENFPSEYFPEIADSFTSEEVVADLPIDEELVGEVPANSTIDETEMLFSSPAEKSSDIGSDVTDEVTVIEEDIASNLLSDDSTQEEIVPEALNDKLTTLEVVTTETSSDLTDNSLASQEVTEVVAENVSDKQIDVESPTVAYTSEVSTEVSVTENSSLPVTTTSVTEKLTIEVTENSGTTTTNLNVSSTDFSVVITAETENEVSQVSGTKPDVVVEENSIAPETTEVSYIPPISLDVKPPIEYEFSPENQPLIGVIDTGFAANNPDIDYSRITLGTDLVANDANPLLEASEGSEHGTHVLGIIAAERNNDVGIDGINDDAPIWVGRAIGSGKWAESLVEFVDAAKNSGQPNAVVNLSLDLTQVNPDGSVTTRYEFTPAERAAIEYARQHNVLIVVAAGNDGGVMSALGQSSQEFDNIITVGAAERVNNSVALSKAYDRADYSSYGYGLDIMADGGTVDNPVLSTTGDSVGTMAGTSVASAKVTGAVSQVWAANPNLSYRQVIEILKDTATDLKTPGWDAETGAGFLNMTAAVLLAKVITPEKYDVLPTLIPDTWSGEGKVTPSERAAATEFMGKYYEWDSYTIKSGDTLSAIALRTMGSGSATYYNFIAQRNGIASASFIYAGSTILIPREVAVPAPTTQPTGNSIVYLSTSGGAILRIDTATGQQNQIYQGRAFTDLAVAPNGKLYGSTFDSLFEINPNNGQETFIGQFTGLGPTMGVNSLTFSPDGKLYGSDSNNGNVFEISPQTAATTPVIWLGALSSGDMVVNSANELLATVTGTNGDRLVTYNLNTRGLTSVDLGFSQVYGLAIQNGQLSAYTANGQKLLINPRTGASTVVSTIASNGQIWGTGDSPNDNNLSSTSTPQPSTTSYSPPGQPGQSRQYVIKSDETLWSIAQRELGDGNRWREIMKTPTGGTFTDAEARQLPVGQSVYLPVTQQVGTGKPITSTPTSVPVQNIILKPGASNLNFSRGQQWVTSTGYKFIFQNDGNLVLYNPQGKPIWATGTEGTGADRFSVQADGNVVLYDHAKAVWATDTPGNPGAYFAIQNDGNLVVYSSNGKPLFDTVTYGGRTGTVTASPDWLKKHTPPSDGMYRNPEAFFRWAVGKVGITRLDGNYNLRGQCVTLIARYIQEVFLPANQRTASRAFGNGKDTARIVSQMLPNSFEPATSSGLPKRGAIISFPDIGIVDGVRYGHVGIVMESRQLSNGQRQVKIMDSNSDSKGVNSTVKEHTYWINIPNGTANGYGANIYWTNPK